MSSQLGSLGGLLEGGDRFFGSDDGEDVACLNAGPGVFTLHAFEDGILGGWPNRLEGLARGALRGRFGEQLDERPNRRAGLVLGEGLDDGHPNRGQLVIGQRN